MFNAHVVEVGDRAEVRRAIEEVGVQPRGVPILTRKGTFRAVKLHGVGYREALIAKQEMLGAGGDAATPKGLVDFSKDAVGVLLLGTALHFRRFVAKMRSQPLQCEAIASEVEEVLSNYDRRFFTLRFPKVELQLDRTLVMGVLNVTPDSFSDGGQFLEPEAAIRGGEEMVRDGADLLDVGAESTRPQSKPLDAGEEWGRLEPVLRGLVDRVDVPISVDTYKSETAERALDLGAQMVNDVTGLRDPQMVKVVARHDVPVVIMHMQGTPQTMQENPQYDDVVSDIIRYLRERITAAIEAGLDKEKIVVDPGIGFGKTGEHNLTLLRRVSEFRSLGRPILLGTSRKSFIGKILDLEVEERLEGSLASAVLAAAGGAHMIRTHDVKETVRALRIADAIQGRASQD